MKKVLICDDCTLIREGLLKILEKRPNIELYGNALNGESLLQIIKTGQQPDIILLNLEETVDERVRLINQIRELTDAKILLLSAVSDIDVVNHTFAAGADGFVLKENSVEELNLAIDYLAAGEKYLAPNLGVKLVSRAVRRSNFRQRPVLSDRERQILNLIARGMTNSVIADKIFVSKRTVEGHRQGLLLKTGSKNTAELVRYACEFDLLE